LSSSVPDSDTVAMHLRMPAYFPAEILTSPAIASG